MDDDKLVDIFFKNLIVLVRILRSRARRFRGGSKP